MNSLGNIDLKRHMVPISKAASAIAALIQRSRQDRAPMVVTQKGYPVAVILDLDVYLDLVNRARDAAADT